MGEGGRGEVGGDTVGILDAIFILSYAVVLGVLLRAAPRCGC